MDTQLIEWIQADLDGVITEEARAQLQEALRSNPEAARWYQEMRTVFASLDGLGSVEPPSDLHHRIKRSLPASPSVTAAPPVRLETRSPVSYRLIPLAAGLVLGFLLHALLYRVAPPTDHRAIVATLIDPAPGGYRRLLQRQEIQREGVSGSVQLFIADQIATIEIDLNSDIALPIDLQFEDSRIRFVGFSQAGYALKAFTTNTSRISFHAEPPVHTLLYFSPSTTPESSPRLDAVTLDSEGLAIRFDWH